MAEMIRIRCTREVMDIHKPYRPELGAVYDAQKGVERKKAKEFVIVDIQGKRIVLRRGEYEILGV